MSDGLKAVGSGSTAREAIADAARSEMAGRIQAVLPEECWVSRDKVIVCTDFIGGTFGNGATWTEELCCLPCRIKKVLDE